MPFVLDNSVVSGWYLANQSTDYTSAVGRRLREDTAHVPGIWALEFTNVLRTACLRQRMLAEQAQQVIAQIGKLPIVVDRELVQTSHILSLSLRFGLSSYDAAYLELALRLQCPIATLDAELKEAAIACGVGWVPQG